MKLKRYDYFFDGAKNIPFENNADLILCVMS